MGRCFLITRAKQAGDHRPGSAEQSFDELGRLLFVDADEVEGLAGDYVTTNQNKSQHAICELIRKSAVEALGYKVRCKCRAKSRSDRHHD